MPAKLRAWVGYLITIACLGYIGYIASQIDWTPLLAAQSPQLVIFFAFGAFGYAFACVLGGLAWWQLVIAASDKDWPAITATAIHARTLIYKYLPSNVLHMAGRHVLTMRVGFGHAALGIALVLELAMSVTGGLIVIAWNYSDLVEPAIRFYEYIMTWVSQDFALLVAAMSITLGGATLFLMRNRLPSFRRLRFSPVLVATGLHVVFLVCAGAIGYAMLGALDQDLTPGFVIGLLTFAWLCGYVTPGVGGGIGVREVVLISAMTPVCGIDVALLFALIWRLITLLGDVLFSCWGHFFAPGLVGDNA